MDEILRRYHAAVKDITSRPYDYLNHRLCGFDQHMAEFEARLNDLKLYVGSYLERAYDPVWETAQAMRFLQKFQRIGRVIPVVSMEIKHNRILNQLLADMDRLNRVLTKFGEEPPAPRNFSPTTGLYFLKNKALNRTEQLINCLHFKIREIDVVLDFAALPGNQAGRARTYFTQRDRQTSFPQVQKSCGHHRPAGQQSFTQLDIDDCKFRSISWTMDK